MNSLVAEDINTALSGLMEQSTPSQMAIIENLTFHAPWAARAFGVTLAAVERGLFSLNDFQAVLIKHIAYYEKANGCIDGEDAYYSAWVAALSDLLQTKALITPGALADGEDKVREALAKLQHDHDHGHDHSHDHDHSDDHRHHHSHHHGAERAPVFVEKRK